MKLPIAAAFRMRMTHPHRLDLQEKRPRHNASACVRTHPCWSSFICTAWPVNTRRKGTAGGRTTQSNRAQAPAENHTPIGAKNSATFLLTDQGTGACNALRVERPLVLWWGQDMA